MSKTTEENQQKSSSERLELMISQLTPNQLRFVVARIACSTDKEAALQIEVKPQTVYTWPKVVKETVQLMSEDIVSGAATIRKRNIAKAMMVKVKALDSEDVAVRQKAATEIIEWEMGKAAQTVDSNLRTPDGPLQYEDVSADTLDAARKRKQESENDGSS